MIKKNTYKILIVLQLLLIVSCNNVHDNSVFSETAAERAFNDLDAFEKQLTSSEHGWLLEYYPAREQPLGGYNYVLSFGEDKNVAVYSERQTDFSVPENSTYNIISNNGSVLTFDTYNAVLHEFSTPSADLYQAQGGDFEFRLLKQDENTIDALGKISRNNVKLLKLNETPLEYLTKVQETNTFLDGATYLLNDTPVVALNRNFTFTAANGENITIAYIHTPNGIKLYEAITLNGDEITEFVLDKNNNQLISLSGNTVIKLNFAPFDILKVWAFDVTTSGEVSPTFLNTFNSIANANRLIYNEILVRNLTLFGASPFTTFQPLSGTGIIFRSDVSDSEGYWVQYKLNFTNDFGSDFKLNITKDSGGFNWSFYTHLEPLIDLITDNSPYSTKPSPVNNPTEVKLTSTTNPDVWFTIRLL